MKNTSKARPVEVLFMKGHVCDEWTRLFVLDVGVTVGTVLAVTSKM